MIYYFGSVVVEAKNFQNACKEIGKIIFPTLGQEGEKKWQEEKI